MAFGHELEHNSKALPTTEKTGDVESPKICQGSTEAQQVRDAARRTVERLCGPD